MPCPVLFSLTRNQLFIGDITKGQLRHKIFLNLIKVVPNVISLFMWRCNKNKVSFFSCSSIKTFTSLFNFITGLPTKTPNTFSKENLNYTASRVLLHLSLGETHQGGKTKTVYYYICHGKF